METKAKTNQQKNRKKIGLNKRPEVLIKIHSGVGLRWTPLS
jgi:hypothetical protein